VDVHGKKSVAELKTIAAGNQLLTVRRSHFGKKLLTGECSIMRELAE
jgi:hypothetical protein